MYKKTQTKRRRRRRRKKPPLLLLWPDRNKKETFDQMSQHQQEAVLLDLFDSFWFEFPIFGSKPSLSPPQDMKVERLPEMSRTVFHARSMSETDVALASSTSNVSPDSVLSLTPKLETVLSGKEADDFFGDGGSRFTNAGEDIARPGSGKGATRRKRRAGIARTSSRSLSELEFEEVKGFMDLGFVFSERDRESATLTSIIPGLNRLGKGGGEVRTEGVSRPYLSEAWGAVELQRKTQAMKWRMQEIGNDNERAMKDQLKFWAQAVSSAVR